MANTLHHHAQLQPKLTAGTNITINDDNVISATGGTTFQYISENADSNTAVKITDDSLGEITVTKDSQTVIANNTIKVNAGSDTAGMLDLHAKFDSAGMLVWRGFSEETVDDGNKIINFDASGPVLNLGSDSINTYFKGSVYDKNGNEILASGGTAYPHITETSDTTIKFGNPTGTETYATISNGSNSSINLVTRDGLSEIKLTEKLIGQSASIYFGDIGAFSSAFVIRIPFTEGSSSLIFSDSNDSYFGSEKVSFSFDNIKALKRLAELSSDQIDRLISMLS